MPFLPKGQQQNQVILNEVAISWHSQSPPFPLALIHFLIDFSGFVCQLVSGRAGSKMTESHGLEGLFSGFICLISCGWSPGCHSAGEMLKLY